VIIPTKPTSEARPPGPESARGSRVGGRTPTIQGILVSSARRKREARETEDPLGKNPQSSVVPRATTTPVKLERLREG
jgi:hypothetical protein